MAKGFKHGAGGGTSLNFKVVGGTSAPSNPKENTIWVNTDIPITHWSFSATRPDNLVKSYIVGDVVAQFQSCLFAEVDLKPNTTYTLAFEGIAGQKFYMNEKIAGWNSFAVEPYWNTVTFTTLSNLDKSVAGQYTPGYGWVLVKNNATLESAPAFRGLRIVEGDKDIEPAGSIWIQTGTSSTVDFNALKKNGIQVYPISAKQYVSGAWVAKVAKSYIGSKWVDWARLPVEYQEVEYIQTTGTQYINTGVIPNTNKYKAETKIELTSTEQNVFVFGTSQDDGYYHMTIYGSKWYYGTNGSEQNVGSVNVAVGRQYEIEYNDVNHGIVVNGSVLVTGKTMTASQPVCIARRETTNGKFKYFYFRFVDNTTNKVLMDLVPCYRRADSVAGMYDLISKKFFTNSGTGTFVVGGDVV